MRFYYPGWRAGIEGTWCPCTADGVAITSKSLLNTSGLEPLVELARMEALRAITACNVVLKACSVSSSYQIIEIDIEV